MSRNKHTETVIKRLLELLISSNIPEHLKEQVRVWFAEDGKRELKDNALRDIFSENIVERKPDQWAHESLSRLKKTIGLEETARIGTKIPLRKRVAFRIAAVVTPVLVIAGALALTMSNNNTEIGNKISYITVSADPYSVKKIMLPDGSTVSIKENSSIRYAADFRQDRSVILDGEAFFSVEKQNGAPFVVEGDGFAVKVLGTEFNVRSLRDENDAVVSLLSGKVEVSNNDMYAELSPGEQFTYNRTTHEEYIEIFDMDHVRDLYLTKLPLNNVSLLDALKAICDFKGVNLEIDSGSSSNNTIQTTFTESDSLEEMLGMLKILTQAFDFDIDGNTVTITSRN